MRNIPANRERLDSCLHPHLFERVPGARISVTYKCAVCSEYADRVAVEGFLQGVRVGRALERREMSTAPCRDADTTPPMAAGALQ